MKLIIIKDDNGLDGTAFRFLASCSLELNTHERSQLAKYGAMPLTRPMPGPIDPTKPVPAAVLTDAELQALVSQNGLSYASDDFREIEDFIPRLTAAVEQVWPYWVTAQNFRGSPVPDRKFDRPAPPTP